MNHLNQNIGNKLTPALATGLLNILDSILPKEPEEVEPKKD